MTKVKLSDFLDNPTNSIRDKNTKALTLEELPPIVIFTDETSDMGSIGKLIEELNNRKKEFYLNPKKIETPVRSFTIYINSDEMRGTQLIY